MTNLVPPPPPSAATISRLLKAAGFRRALKNTTSWSSGFDVQGFHTHARVTYASVNRGAEVMILTEMRDSINSRDDKKYWAKIQEDRFGNHLWVERWDEADPEQNETRKALLREKLAEESPYGVTIAEVRKALHKAGGFFEFVDGKEKGAGFCVSAEPAPNDRLVRVTYRDHPHTAYAFVEGGRDRYMREKVQQYAEKLAEAGYSVQIDYADGEDSVLVGQAGEFQAELSQEEESELAQEPLMELRKAVEENDLAFMTRKGGPTSIFVYYLVPFKDKVRRVEVFWRNGSYGSYGRFGGPTRQEFHNTDLTVQYIRSEIAD